MKAAVKLSMALILAVLSGGCQSIQYYGQAVGGQIDIWLDQRDIEKVLADPHTDRQTRARLRLALQARKFASSQLQLPDNASYSSYVDLGRDFVVWNVVATGPYSVEPHKSCFPVVGCLSYRGYYQKEDALAYGEQLKQDGLDVFIGGVSAYSTLGWFSDPLLSSMFVDSDTEIAALIFHELAHQRVYIKDDTRFNESFATAVEQLGLEQWLATRHMDASLVDYLQERERRAAVIALILSAREQMRRVYAENADRGDEVLEGIKREQFEQLRQRYAMLRNEGGGTAGFDRFFAGRLNNASLALFGEYHGWVGAFKQLFENSDRDWEAFYQEVENLSRSDMAERELRLNQLSG